MLSSTFCAPGGGERFLPLCPEGGAPSSLHEGTDVEVPKTASAPSGKPSLLPQIDQWWPDISCYCHHFSGPQFLRSRTPTVTIPGSSLRAGWSPWGCVQRQSWPPDAWVLAGGEVTRALDFSLPGSLVLPPSHSSTEADGPWGQVAWPGPCRGGHGGLDLPHLASRKSSMHSVSGFSTGQEAAMQQPMAPFPLRVWGCQERVCPGPAFGLPSPLHDWQPLEAPCLSYRVFPFTTVFMPFLSPVCVCRRSVVSSSLWPCGLQPARLLCPWNFPGKNTGVGCHFLPPPGDLPDSDQTCFSHVSCIADGFFTTELSRKPFLSPADSCLFFRTLLPRSSART